MKKSDYGALDVGWSCPWRSLWLWTVQAAWVKLPGLHSSNLVLPEQPTTAKVHSGQFEPDLGRNGSVTAKLASSKVSDYVNFRSSGVVHSHRFRRCAHAFWKLHLCVISPLSRKLSLLCSERPGGAAKDWTFPPYSWKIDGMQINWQHPIAPPRPTNARKETSWCCKV